MSIKINRLEEQHREEIDSYRMELNKRQREVVELRRQLSENRRAPTSKSEVLSFMKVLQIKDNRLADEIEVRIFFFVLHFANSLSLYIFSMIYT